MRILAEDLAGDLTDMMDQQTENGSTKPDPLEDPLRRLNQPLDDMFSAGVREWVRKHREYRSMETDFPSPDPRNGLAGLAMSGGGRRSAVFNLGVAQALAEYGVIHTSGCQTAVMMGGLTGGLNTGKKWPSCHIKWRTGGPMIPEATIPQVTIPEVPWPGLATPVRCSRGAPRAGPSLAGSPIGLAPV